MKTLITCTYYANLKLVRHESKIYLKKLTNFVELSPSQEIASCVTTHEFPAFYETQRFITMLKKETSNGPYSEPDQSRLYLTIKSLQDPLNITHPTYQ
jgi:hypothetical protein